MLSRPDFEVLYFYILKHGGQLFCYPLGWHYTRAWVGSDLIRHHLSRRSEWKLYHKVNRRSGPGGNFPPMWWFQGKRALFVLVYVTDAGCGV